MAYPSTLDSFAAVTNGPSPNDPPPDSSWAAASVVNAWITALNALEAKVGITGSAVTSSLDYLTTNGISTFENVGGGTRPANNQAYIKSAATTSVPLIIDTPASPSVDLLKLRVNGADTVRFTYAGTVIAPTFYGALVSGGTAPANTSNYAISAGTTSVPLVIDSVASQTADLLDLRNNGTIQAFVSASGQLALGAGAAFFNSEQLKVAINPMSQSYQSVMVIAGTVSASAADVKWAQQNQITATHTTGTVNEMRAADYSAYYSGTSATNPAVQTMTGFNTYTGIGGASPSGTIATANLVNIGALYAGGASGTPAVTVSLQNGLSIGDMKAGATGVTVTNANAIRIYPQTTPGYAIYAQGRSYIQNNSAGDITLTLDTVASQTADILDWNVNGTNVGKIDKNGALYSTASVETLTATAPAIATGGTITPSLATGVMRVAPTGNVTGIIVAAGSVNGQFLTVVNESAFTLTMAASGTSHVANGTTCVIAANASRSFVYDTNTSLWYAIV